LYLADVYSDNGSLDVNKLEKYITKDTVESIAACWLWRNSSRNGWNYDDCVKNIIYMWFTILLSQLVQFTKEKWLDCQGDVPLSVFTETKKSYNRSKGGAFVTNDDSIAEESKYCGKRGTNKIFFSNWNKTRGYYEYVDIGNSYVQSNINAAMGVSQLKKFRLDE